MNKNLLFLIIDLLLVGVVGSIFGLACGDYIFSTSSGIASFATLLVVLLIPSLIYVLKKKLNTANIVVSTLFVLAEIVSCVIFVSLPKLGLTNFAITEGVVVGIFLIALLVVIAFYKVDEAD